MRLIDADALIEDVRKNSVSYFADDFAHEWVDKQPTIEPERKKGKWIPVTERLPEENGLYLVTNVGRWVEPVGTRYYNIRADGGFWSGHPGDKVLAWMPLPEPYVDDIPNEYFESGGKRRTDDQT